MPVVDQRVRPKRQKLTDGDARHLLAHGLLPVALRLGPDRVGVEIGCNEKTVRRARDEDSTLGLACAINLLGIDEHALDALLASQGFMLVPLVAEGADIIPTAGAAIHRIGQNRSPQSDGGAVETDRELIATEPENDALLAAVLERRASIAEAKLRMAAA